MSSYLLVCYWPAGTPMHARHFGKSFLRRAVRRRTIGEDNAHRPKSRLALSRGFLSSSPGSHFQPEPGCSEPTFVGSHTDVLALSSSMLNLAASALDSMSPTEAIIQFAEQPSLLSDSCQLVTVRVPASVVSMDPESSFEVRVNRRAWTMMVGHIETSAQIYGTRLKLAVSCLERRMKFCGRCGLMSLLPRP